MIDIFPSMPEDIENFYGKKSSKTIKALSVFRDSELVMITGVTIEKDKIVAFSDIKDGVVAPKMTIWRTAKKIAQHIADMKLPVIAITDSGKFLESLGFIYCGKCEEGKIYRI